MFTVLEESDSHNEFDLAEDEDMPEEDEDSHYLVFFSKAL